MRDGFSQNLINRQQEIDNRLLEEYKLQLRSRKTRWIRLSVIRNLINFDVEVEAEVEAEVEVDIDSPLFKKILTKAKDRVEAWGGELYFVYLPEYERYNSTNIMHDVFRKKSEVINLVKTLNIPVIDIHKEVFVNHPDLLALYPFRAQGHYNARGYAEVAKAIVDGIKQYEDHNDE